MFTHWESIGSWFWLAKGETERSQAVQVLVVTARAWFHRERHAGVGCTLSTPCSLAAPWHTTIAPQLHLPVSLLSDILEGTLV